MSWTSGYQFRVKEPGARERIFPLEEKSVRVERAGVQIPSLKLLLLNDPAVSRHHATLKWQMLDQTFLLVLASKTNPMIVNGESFRSVLLCENDVLVMGDTKMRLESVEQQSGQSTRTSKDKHCKPIRDNETATEVPLLEKALASEKLEAATSQPEKPKFTWKPPEER